MSKALSKPKPVPSYTESIKYAFLMNSHSFSIPIPTHNTSSSILVTSEVIYIYIRDHSRSATEALVPRPEYYTWDHPQSNNWILVLCKLGTHLIEVTYDVFPHWFILSLTVTIPLTLQTQHRYRHSKTNSFLKEWQRMPFCFWQHVEWRYTISDVVGCWGRIYIYDTELVQKKKIS